MEVNQKPGVSYSNYNVGEEMWASIKPFNYNLPSTLTILINQWRSIAALAFWLILLTGIAHVSYPKISIL